MHYTGGISIYKHKSTQNTTFFDKDWRKLCHDTYELVVFPGDF